MHNRLLSALGVLLFACASTAQTSGAPDPAVSQAEAYLGSIDTPISAAQWRALGTKVGPFLARTVEDKSAFPTRRARALEGLTWADPARARAEAPALAATEQAPLVVRQAAIWSVSKTCPKEKVLSVLRPLLEGARSAQVRAFAAKTLAEAAPAEGCEAIHAQVMREPVPERTRYRTAVEHCRAQNGK